MEITIFRPDGYDAGVYRIDIALSPDEESIAGQFPFECAFELPDLPSRLITADKLYRVMIPAQGKPLFGGKLVDGRWQGQCRTNGVLENKNPTPIEVVKEALETALNELLTTMKRYHD